MISSASITILTFVFILVISFFISWFNSFKKQKAKKKQLKKFNDFVIKNHLTIDSKQHFNKNIIGIDRINFAVVFLNFRAKRFFVVRLKEVGGCQLIKDKNKITAQVNHIYLKCVYLQKEKPPVIISFYNENFDDVYMMMKLSKIADYWAKKIRVFWQTAKLKNGQRLTTQ